MSPAHEAALAVKDLSSKGLCNGIDIQFTPFDQKHYLQLIAARGETLRRVVNKLIPALQLSTCVDAGCGVGFFTKTLEESGLNVCGFDGRMENIEEARKRFPEIPFEQADMQSPAIQSLGKFDFVLCFGLLYHLENPLLAIRHLRALTGKCLLLESMCLPDEQPAMLLREEPRQNDQSLTDIACYSSEATLVKMLYRAGFKSVYRVIPLPDHEDFRETKDHARRRTVLLASLLPVDLFGFRLLPEPRETEDPWAKNTSRQSIFFQRAKRFLTSSARTKYLTIAHRARRIFPNLPIPWLLPFGTVWLAEKSALDHELLYNGFEPAELQFVEKFLRIGMTVLDVGAHHGLYTLLASRRVGQSGLVVAFEPSPRECKRLTRHIRWNRCRNVRLEECALGNENGEADLFRVDGFHDWCNSLRKPQVWEPVSRALVKVRKIDDVLSELDIHRVDFIKLDIEGAELSFLQGAKKLLHGSYRPVILAEVQDCRTVPWGYRAWEIVEFLAERNYRWFAIESGGLLREIVNQRKIFDANLVAVPDERIHELLTMQLKPASLASKASSDHEFHPSLWFGEDVSGAPMHEETLF